MSGGGDDLRAFQDAYDQIESEYRRLDQVQTWYTFWGTVSDDFSAMKKFLPQTVHFLTAGHIFESQLANDLYESLGYGTDSIGTWTTILADPKPNLKKSLYNAWHSVDDTYHRVSNYATSLGGSPSSAKVTHYATTVGQLRDDLQQVFDDLKADFFDPLLAAKAWEGPGGSKDIGSRPLSEKATRAVATTPLLNYAKEFLTAGQQGRLPVDSRYSEDDGPLSGAAWAVSRTAATHASTFSVDMHQGLDQTGKALQDYVAGLTSADQRGAQEIEGLVHGRPTGPMDFIVQGIGAAVGEAKDLEAKAGPLLDGARPIVSTLLHGAETFKDGAVARVKKDFSDFPSVMAELERMREGGASG